MNSADVEALVSRDWRWIEQLKQDQWRGQKAAMTPAAAREFAARLLVYARAVKPDWPDPRPPGWCSAGGEMGAICSGWSERWAAPQLVSKV